MTAEFAPAFESALSPVPAATILPLLWIATAYE
jgi:hypothetical protein